jgi:hypothetical protein
MIEGFGVFYNVGAETRVNLKDDVKQKYTQNNVRKATDILDLDVS